MCCRSLPAFGKEGIDEGFAPSRRFETTRAGSGASGPGLSKGHILTNPLPITSAERPAYRIETWKDAGLLRIVTPYRGERSPREESKRGQIKGYSSKARARARAFLAKIPDADMLSALMVTLTYPGNDCPDAIPEAKDWERYKDHLRRFGQETKRKWNASAVWVLEFQKRGAPHYHLLVFGVGEAQMIEFREWVAKEWNRIVGGDAKHLQAGTQCDLAKSPHGARAYLVKYMTKGEQALEGLSVGRYWGKVNGKAIPQAEELVEEITPAQAIIAARVARKWMAKRRWDSSWSRLKSRAGKGNDLFRGMDREQFRAMCLRFNGGKTAYIFDNGCGEAFVSHLALQFALNRTFEKAIQWPQRPRMRDNATLNVFCRASSFMEALKRHPAWNPYAGTEQVARAQRPVRTYVLARPTAQGSLATSD